MRTLHYFQALLAVTLAAGCAHAPETTGPLRGEELARGVDGMAGPLISSGDVLGLSIAVVRNDSVLFARGYGHADLARTVPCDENTTYWIASVTKLFTAATLLRLAEEGRLDLDRSVLHYLPEIGNQWDSVTVRHTLNHTSGIPDFVVDADARARQGLDVDHAFTAEWTRRAQPLHPVGARWTYTNTAFHLAGMIAERASGEPFDAALAHSIVTPLDLARTGFGFSDSMRGTWRVIQRDGDSLVDFRLLNEHALFTDGGISSTAIEVAAVLRGLFSGGLLKSESIAQMTRRTPTTYGDMDYGFGVRLGSLDGHPKIGHTGGYESVVACAAYYPEDSLAVVVLLNTDGAQGATDIEARIARLVLGIPAPSLSRVRLDPDQIQRLSGTYEMRSEGHVKRFELFERGGRLFERRVAPGAEPSALVHVGNGTFANPDWGELRLVATLEGARNEMILETWGGFFGDVAYRIDDDG